MLRTLAPAWRRCANQHGPGMAGLGRRRRPLRSQGRQGSPTPSSLVLEDQVSTRQPGRWSQEATQQRTGDANGGLATTRARADIDDERARGDPGFSDDQFGPAPVERMPSPRAWIRHGDAP